MDFRISEFAGHGRAGVAVGVCVFPVCLCLFGGVYAVSRRNSPYVLRGRPVFTL